MIEVYSDGSSSGGSDAPGGYGWIVVQDGCIRFVGHGGHPSTTNNLMEMTGALEGLRAVRRSGIRAPGERLLLVADSQYTLGIASGRMTPTKNLELATVIRTLCRELGMNYVGPEFSNPMSDFRWVPGHRYKRGLAIQRQPRDVLLNERCDQLARMGREALTP